MVPSNARQCSTTIGVEGYLFFSFQQPAKALFINVWRVSTRNVESSVRHSSGLKDWRASPSSGQSMSIERQLAALVPVRGLAP